jgi:hypothetical protein
VIDEESRKTSAYTDPTYVPFYYYLGTQIQPKTFLEIGFRLGLLSGCFLKGCQSVDTFLGFQEETEEFYSFRLGRANIRSVFKKDFQFYLGKINDEIFLDEVGKRKWDLIVINEEKDYDTHRLYLDILWEHLPFEGLIVMDYIKSHEPSKKAYEDFCKIQNREPIIFGTRYGTGVIEK